jgi:predicted  nucleic acid-binding Zn-ribbon protein
LSSPKDTYEAFHDAMGNWERIPFEHLSDREQAAWARISGLSEYERESLYEAQNRARGLRRELESAQDERAGLRLQVSQMEEQIEALKSQINAFDSGIPAHVPAASSKPAKPTRRRKA